MDLFSNAISTIKNGYNWKLLKVKVRYNNMVIRVLDILYKLGYINGYSFDMENKRFLWIYLKYINNKPCLRNIVRISTPGKRVYFKVNRIRRLLSMKNNGFILFSTHKGILTDEEVLLFKIGGEALLKVM